MIVAPSLVKSQHSASQWGANLSSHLKEAHSEAQTWDLQNKATQSGAQTRVYVTPKPGSPSKLQNHWHIFDHT
jgi:hypothetical protein